jgi:hemolysin-activating ACP:hemolysin acyltransferase
MRRGLFYGQTAFFQSGWQRGERVFVETAFFNPVGSGNSIFYPVKRRFFQECSIAVRGEKGAAGQTIQQEIRRIDDESMTDR